ncbi:HAD family phosphatase [uncultured Tessaracoccus sp.]|uniref:HAD family hydrolase n=1 Tax=uncultured Tessaracoccus sp. TaxID=905023 RepID=UPI0025F0BEAD|nr:HAD-IA family hydrolase [uncultured Tessaracoccus sp.]
MDWSAHEAALFDLDGVITPTAEIHMRAWSEMFNAFLDDDQPRYTDDDYFRHVDGKPRYDGVRDFLASRGIELPWGSPEDDPGARTVCGLGNAKNEQFNVIIARDGVQAYPGSVRLVEHLVALGTKLAVVSSSKNAPAVLRAAGLDQHFPVIVDGNLAAREQLAGKPAPDTFQRAAELLGAAEDRSVVLEDAISGVAAGAAGDFALVVGVNRGVGADALREAGADVVVEDLGELL